MNCKICNCEVGIIKTIQPFFRHLDFATIAKKINLIKCFKCQSIINPFLENQELFSFTTKEYANSHQTKQTMYVDKSIKPVTRSSLQAKILHEKLIINEKNNILDFGCFDGHLLIELDKILNNCEFWGYDINPHLQSLFPKKDNFHFILKNLRNLEVKFDLIILSHSVIYVPDFTELMVSIDQLLKQDGTLFIQIPDISINPFYSLMGDQTVIFTKVSLTNALANFGYELVSINNDYFPREALFFAQKNENILDKYNYSMDYTFEKNLQLVHQVLFFLNLDLYTSSVVTQEPFCM